MHMRYFQAIPLKGTPSSLLLKVLLKETDNGYLICSYSSVRYRKDGYEMKKQLESKDTTNLEESVIDNKTVIERYHELYKIEQAFRISKLFAVRLTAFLFKKTIV